MNSLKCMNIEDLSEEAELNFRKHLKENCYPGRGIVLGCDSGGNPVLIYWIMGRSLNSRNRIFAITEEGVVAFRWFKGSYNGNTYVDFMKEVLEKKRVVNNTRKKQ